MKKYIGTFLISCGLCLMFGYYFFNTDNMDNVIYVLVEGGYNNLEEANNKASNLPSAVVLKDNNEYLVYLAMYEDITLINKMLDYYKSKDINVSLKEIKCNKYFHDELNKYESVAGNLSDYSLYNEVNQNILDLYVGSL